ncbi:hypothetical protein CF394_11235 [Tetzosporium hominis]|uniref:Tail spike domain-containing protein n=1 Tax=Tetzosporium hominis TaxID=2020506 RepID=A0A264W331_9BACL|nr:phage tail spike protein [Tetzosporium hominis]OZS77447.1 hypothetical protein CF394_11235 [Tetzosporium hominis]
MSIIYLINPNTDRIVGHLNNRGKKIFTGGIHIHDLETGENTFTFETPSKLKEAALFDNIMRLAIPKEEGGLMEFVTYRTRTKGAWREVIALASYVDIESQAIIPPGTYSGTCEDLLTIGLAGVDYSVGTVEPSDIRELILDESVRPYTFIMKVKELFDREFDATIEFSGPRVKARYLNAYTKLGRNNKKEIVRGKDLLSIERIENKERIVTALQVEGPQREDGTRLTVFVSDDEAFQRWSVKGEHRIDIYRPETDDQNITAARLTSLGKRRLKQLIDAINEYTIESADIGQLFPHEQLWIGDNCRIIDKEYSPPLYADARAKRIERSIIDKKEKKIKFGEVVTYKESDVLKKFRQLSEIYQTRFIRQPTAPPVRARTIWIKSSTEVGGAEVAHIASGNQWIPVTPTNVVELDKNYNGWYFDAEEGLVVYRDDNLVRIVLDSTSGIKIQRRTLVTDTWKDAFGVDSAGNMILVGELFTPSIEKGFGGAWYGDEGWYVFGDGSSPVTYADNRGMHISNHTMSGSSVDYALEGMWHYVAEYMGGPPVRSLLYGENGIRLFDENSPLPAKEVLSGLLFNDRKIQVIGSFETQAIQSLTLMSGWLNFSSTSEPWQRAGFYKDLSGVVHLTGLIKDGTTANGTVLGTLPVGYRPAKQEVFTVATSSGTARIDVYPNGQIIGARDLNATFTSLSGPSFKAA